MAADRPELNRLEVLRTLRRSNWEAVFSTLHATLTTGAFLTGFALWLGANDFWMGILGSIPTVAGLIQIFSSYIVERRGERKWFTAWFTGAARLLWVPILLAPLLPTMGARFAVFVLLYLASSILLNVPVPAFLSWLSDLVPPDNRGRYFGRRNMLAGVTAMVVSLPAGWWLDTAVKRLHAPMLGFGSLFGAAVVCGAVGFVLLLRQSEPPMQRMQASDARGLRALFDFYRAPFREANFRRLMLFSSAFAVAQFIAAPFYTVYALKELGLTYTTLQVLGALTSLTSLLSMPLWGYLGDKYGNKPLLVISVFGTGLLPVAWAFTSREHMTATLAIITGINLLGGLAWAGVGLAGFNLLIGASPSERKSVYVGAMSAVTGLTGGLAPIVGGIIMTALQPVHFEAVGLRMGNYQVLFTLNTVLRFSTLFLLRGVADAGATTAREVLAQLGATRMGAWVQMRRLQRASTEERRLRATQALRSARAALAVEELISALDDASMHVREEAAEALGEIGDPRAVDALIARLDDPASGIVDEAAGALGRIGDPRAIEPLAAVLERGDTADRVAAARALGRIGGPAAARALASVADSGDPAQPDETAEACLVALGRAGDAVAVPTLVRWLCAPRSARLAAVRALGDIGAPEAAGPLLGLLADEQDPAVISHAAVALGMVGAGDAVRPLLAALDRVRSPIARKQILNAVGALVDDTGGFYALLSAEPMARDEAVSRLLGEFGRPGDGRRRGEFGPRRRERQAQRVLEHYLAGQMGEAVLVLARTAPPPLPGAGSEPTRDTLDWAVETAGRRPLTPDEFALAVFAARRLVG